MDSQRPAREPDALCGQRLWKVKAEALVAMVNLQSTLAVLCKAAKSAAGYQSHPQSPWNLLEVLQPQPAADSYLVQKPQKTSQTHVQGSGSR
ncbi:uncharacterized protein TRIREDRAFT_121638 [Trichoderma reesei QM6a]|uniref:Predicted protein n=2 Tax=Hypocrea jecorina TaxID=51453 RepID=G0RIX1_HYPJQ|nr:uncharacterized protein TRIREDRAFT_121638 [Trichoderma reesei QM6a]EGR49164.1 predicted protein [Trichoderma reesei QM6a]ETS02467.1 hypothetical protein M419DRAFT_98367 [Trichoderma reesei RUT C-30]